MQTEKEEEEYPPDKTVSFYAFSLPYGVLFPLCNFCFFPLNLENFVDRSLSWSFCQWRDWATTRKATTASKPQGMDLWISGARNAVFHSKILSSGNEIGFQSDVDRVHGAAVVAGPLRRRPCVGNRRGPACHLLLLGWLLVLSPKKTQRFELRTSS